MTYTPKVLNVPKGGTDGITHTSHGILLGAGTSAIVTTNELSNGQILIGSTGNNPVAGTISEGEAIDVAVGAGTVTVACEDWSETNKGVGELSTDAESIAGSATGVAVVPSSLKAKLGLQTAYTIPVGTGQTTALGWVGPGTQYQVLQSGGASANPAYSTATYPATTTKGDLLYSSANNTISNLTKDTNATRYLSNTGTDNVPKWDQVNLSNGVTGTLGVTSGGTGQTSYTDGQLLIGNSTGNTLTVNTLTAGSNISITNGAGTITIACTAPATTTWEYVSAATKQAVVNYGYMTDNAGGVVVTLPNTAARGDILEICGMQGLWSIAQNAGESITYGNQVTTIGVAGSLTATHARDTVRLLCVVANTDWQVLSNHGNLTVA